MTSPTDVNVKAQPMAYGSVYYRTFGFAAFFCLISLMNQFVGCSKSMEGWGWGKYNCGTIETGLFANMNMLALTEWLVMSIGATLLTRKIKLAKMLAPYFIMGVCQFGYLSSDTVNDHTMPNSTYVESVVIWGCTALAFVRHKQMMDDVKAQPQLVPYGALHYWAFGCGAFFVLMSLVNQFMGCSKAMQSWGWGSYDCNDMPTAIFASQDIAQAALWLLVIMCAVERTSKMALAKTIVPYGILSIVLSCRTHVFFNQQSTLVYSVNVVVWGSMVGAFYLHKEPASARDTTLMHDFC